MKYEAAIGLVVLLATASATMPQWFDHKCELQEFVTTEASLSIPMDYMNSYLYRACSDVSSPLQNKSQFGIRYFWTEAQRGEYWNSGFYCGYKYYQNGWKFGTFWSGFYTGKPDRTMLYASLNGDTTCTYFDYYQSKFLNPLWT